MFLGSTSRITESKDQPLVTNSKASMRNTLVGTKSKGTKIMENTVCAPQKTSPRIGRKTTFNGNSTLSVRNKSGANNDTKDIQKVEDVQKKNLSSTIHLMPNKSSKVTPLSSPFSKSSQEANSASKKGSRGSFVDSASFKNHMQFTVKSNRKEGDKTRNFGEPELQRTRSGIKPNTSKINTSTSREKTSSKILKGPCFTKLPNHDYYQLSSNKSRFLKFHILDRRSTMGSEERKELLSQQTTASTTSSIKRDGSKPPLPEYGGDTEEGRFKAKRIPKSHNVPHMVFSSTKELTKPKEFHFHDRKSRVIKEDEEEDDEAQVIQYGKSKITFVKKSDIAKKVPKKRLDVSGLYDESSRFNLNELISKAKESAKFANISCKEIEKQNKLKRK